MTAIALLFIGSVLLVNGLTLLGTLERRESALVNALVGAVVCVAAFRVALPILAIDGRAGQDRLLAAAGFLLFGLTYLWVAANGWTGHRGRGLGWYCAWAAAVSVFLGVVSFTRLDDPKEGLLWVLWAVLFAVFFLVLALDRVELTVAAGWLAIIESVVTATVPGAMMLLGAWADLSTWWVAAATVGTLLALGVLVARRPPTASA